MNEPQPDSRVAECEHYFESWNDTCRYCGSVKPQEGEIMSGPETLNGESPRACVSAGQNPGGSPTKNPLPRIESDICGWANSDPFASITDDGEVNG